MRVCCGACGSTYQVADELVAGRRVRLRCRACGAAIPVGDDNAGPPRPVPPPPPVPAWFVAAGVELAGPFFLRDVIRGIRCGELFADDHLWQAGTRDWIPVAEVPEVAAKIDVGTIGARPQSVLPVSPRSQLSVPQLPEPSSPKPRRVGVWIWLATAGAVVVAVAAMVVFLQRRDVRERRKDEASPPIAIHIDKAEFRIAPSKAGSEIRQLPAFEVKLDKRRPRRTDGGAKKAGDGSVNSGRAESIHRRIDKKNVLAQRLFRLSEGGFVACARIAERRGATIEGRSAEFAVEVDGEGKVTVKVEGKGLSVDLLRCYKAIVSAWQLPKTGQPYRLMFRLPH